MCSEASIVELIRCSLPSLNLVRHPSGVIDGPQGTQTFPTSLDSSAGSAVAATAIIKFEGYNTGGSGATSQWQLSDEMVLRWVTQSTFWKTLSTWKSRNGIYLPSIYQYWLTWRACYPATPPPDITWRQCRAIWMRMTMRFPWTSSCSSHHAHNLLTVVSLVSSSIHSISSFMADEKQAVQMF